MKARIDFAKHLLEQINGLAKISHGLETILEPSLYTLIHSRASQINGCTFCLDMDMKKAKLRGEKELKMYHIAVWRESPLFSQRERAALEWTEAVNSLTPAGVSDEVFNRVREHFSDAELAAITMTIGVTITWNRLNVSFQNPPGGLDKMYGLDKAGLD